MQDSLKSEFTLTASIRRMQRFTDIPVRDVPCPDCDYMAVIRKAFARQSTKRALTTSGFSRSRCLHDLPFCLTDYRARPQRLGHRKGGTLACRLAVSHATPNAAAQPEQLLLEAEASGAARRRTASRTGLCPFAGLPCRRPRDPTLPPV